MSLYITSLNSGSNGNCYYIGNEHEAILIDAGISCRETERRMSRLGLSPEKVNAVFISHEHSDHIRGLTSFTKKYRVPVYITPDTLKYGRLWLDHSLVRTFSGSEPVTVGSITVTAFQKQHDASDPYSFVASCLGVNVGIFTDIGLPCSGLIRHFSRCHAAFLESNYDEEMLDKGGYPIYLKNRIRGGKGHLSNRQALELFRRHRPSFMSHLLLAHLSQNNNCPHLVQDLFDAHAGPTKIIVASRFEETPVFVVRPSEAAVPLPPPPAPSVSQLTLSF